MAYRLTDAFLFIAYPFEIDYGEGIVWQQAELMFTSSMYSAYKDLPFIVFHYPPAYHMAVRLIAPLFTTMLEAGRTLSLVSTIVLTGLIAWLARLASGGNVSTRWAVGLACGLAFFCLAAVRSWSDLMRVDMLAFAFAFAGLVVASTGRPSVIRTALALLLCTAAVFTKQTCFAAGVAIAVQALWIRPRHGLIAVSLAGTVGLSAAALLQAVTHGGFFQNIVGYNLNPWSVAQVWTIASYAARDSIIIAGTIVSALSLGVLSRWEARAALEPDPSFRVQLHLLHWLICTLMLWSIGRDGSSVNYTIEWLGAGLVLMGITGCALMTLGRPIQATLVLGTIGFGTLLQPLRVYPEFKAAQEADRPAVERVVRLIAAAAKPVSSENMTLIMQASQRVWYEPAIVTELVKNDQWDERPLVAMIEARGFAFMLTKDDRYGPNSIRTPAVDAAMRRAYPRVERLAQRLWINLPE